MVDPTREKAASLCQITWPQFAVKSRAITNIQRKAADVTGVKYLKTALVLTAGDTWRGTRRTTQSRA